MKRENITEIHIPNNPNSIIMGGIKEVELFDVMYAEGIRYCVEKYNIQFTGKGIKIDIWLTEDTRQIDHENDSINIADNLKIGTTS